MNEILIGLDLGTTLAKCAAFDTGGNELAVAQREIPTDRSMPNGAEQNPGDWTSALLAVMKEVGAKLDDMTRGIVSIGLSAHGPGVVLVGADGNPLLPCAIWQDNRSAGEGYRLFEEIGYDWVGHGLPQTGLAARLKWLRRNYPDALDRASHIHDIKGYLLHFLTGERVTEPSSSAGGRSWNAQMLSACGIDPGRMDEVIPSDAVVGRLREELARAAGFPSHTRVVSGLNDGASAMLGSGTIKPGEGVLSVSTNGVARIVTPDKLPGRYLAENSMFCWPYVDEKYVAGGFTKSAGDTVQWWADIAYRDLPERSRLRALNREAMESGIGARGVSFYPWLLGRGSPSASDLPAGEFRGMARRHGRGDLSRAVFEGIAFALRDIVQQFRYTGYPFEKARLTGGGMKSEVWLDILCSVARVEGQRVRSDSLIGAGMLAGVGCGVYPDIEKAAEICVRPVGNPLLMKPDAVGRYEELYREYVRAKNTHIENDADAKGGSR